MPGVVLLFAGVLFGSAALGQISDREACERIIASSIDQDLGSQPIGDLIVTIGMQFLGRPYEAGTLDRGEQEELVTNLHSFDCVTLVENVLALARAIKRRDASYVSFQSELQRIRYRDGVIDGYASRLHYFTDWIIDNERRGLVKNVSSDLGGKTRKRTINFISTHRERYPMLSTDSLLGSIVRREQELSAQQITLVPRSGIKQWESAIREGDIIAVTTTQVGLDVSHTGFAVRGANGRVHLLHAPDVGDSVQLSAKPLADYILSNKKRSGIIVVRALEPAE